jgi:hypothetical protein
VILQGLNSRKTRQKIELPTDYVVAKFYEFGFQPQHNKYNGTYQCGCPICREGKSLGRKKRCFYIPDQDLIYCHNCGWSSQPLRWVMKVSGLEETDILNELEDDSYDLMDASTLNEPTKAPQKLPSLPDDCINLTDPAQLAYHSKNSMVKAALDYAIRRHLFSAVNKCDVLYFSLSDKVHKHRLILPFKDENNKIVFYQSRKIFDWDERPTYLSKLNADKTLFGIDRVDGSLNDSIFIFEGPIDACFVENGVGVGGITKGDTLFNPLQEEQMVGLKLFDRIWCLDSQYLDQTSLEKSMNLLERGEKVFIWPENIGTLYKDFNQVCVEQNIDKIPCSFIKKHTYQGSQGIIKLKLITGKVKK